ncbi:MAG: redoxin family protein [Ignavibacteriales bacterium]|nr:redoxin family protein [Ignavibacteriales bacterium]
MVTKTTRMLKIFLSLIAIIIGAQNMYSQQKVLDIYEKPSLQIIGDSSDTKLTIEYKIPYPAFVELKIYDRLGFLSSVPVYSFQDAGVHSIIIDKNNLNVGYHSIYLQLNHDRESSVEKSFDHNFNGKYFTSSRKEENYLNRAMMSTAQAPEKSKLLYDTLLTKYPNWMDRRALFSYALITYMIVSDSLSVSSIIDSIENYSPNSEVYNMIAMTPAYLKKYLPIGIKYAQKAIDNIDDLPLHYRNSKLFDYKRNLGENYLANSDYELAIKTYLEALTTYQTLPAYDLSVKYEFDLSILSKLGMIYEIEKKYEFAKSYYKIALTKDPTDEDNWLALQRIYTILNHSDEGYNSYKENFIKTIPKEKLIETKTYKYVGKTFPRFSLKTIDDKKHDETEIKGKVTVINYWAYWCGTCLEERPDLEKIYNDFKNEKFSLLSMHSQIGLFNNLEEETELVKNVLKKYPTSFPTLIQTNDNKTPRIGVNAVPTTVILDKKGVVRFEEIGYDKFQFYDRVKKNILQLLEEK